MQKIVFVIFFVGSLPSSASISKSRFISPDPRFTSVILESKKAKSEQTHWEQSKLKQWVSGVPLYYLQDFDLKEIQKRLLFQAVYTQNLKLLTYLIAQGADLNVKNTFSNSFVDQERSFTPLYAATLSQAKEVIELLLQAGADPSITCYSMTPLHHAIQRFKHTQNPKWQEIIEILQQTQKTPRTGYSSEAESVDAE
jgi:ankyrin repeat protein